MERYESIKPASRIFFFSSKAGVGPYMVILSNFHWAATLC